MQISSANLNVDSTIAVDRLSVNSVSVDAQSIIISNTQIVNSTQISMGAVSLTPSGFSTPMISIGGSAFGLGTTMGVVNSQFFTANGTWTKPPTANNSDPRNQVLVMAWGGGGGAASNTTVTRSGGGGACVVMTFPLSSLSSNVAVTVGDGGTASRTAGTLVAAGDGGNTSFGSLIAYGGGGGATTATGGGGGGTFDKGTGGAGGGPLGGASATPGGNSTYGGAGGSTTTGSTGGSSIFGGGGGVQGSGNGGISIFGGGGGGQGVGSVVGSSVLGGSGGLNGTAGITPGGGGSANTTVANTGARGEVRVWVIGPGPIQSSYQPTFSTYALSPNTTTQYEGNTVTFNVSTVGVANNTTLYYTLNNSSSAVRNDFTAAVNGSITVVSGSASFTLTANNTATIQADRSYTMDLREGSSTGNIVASTSNVSIIHTVRDIAYEAVVSGNGASNTYTFNNVDIGVPSVTRTVVFGVGVSGREIGSFTVNGVQLTPRTQRSVALDRAIYSMDMSQGSTANVVIKDRGGASTFTAAALATWTIYNLANTTPYRTYSSGNDNEDIFTAANDIVIAIASHNDTTTPGAFSSGTLGMTLNFTETARAVAGSDDLVVKGASVKASGTGNNISFSGYSGIEAIQFR